MFNFEIVKLFSKVVVMFHILTNNVWGFQLLHIPAKTAFVWYLFNLKILNFSHFDCSVVVSHCGFDLHFSED